LSKLNVLHRLERLSKRIAQLENNEVIEAREINSLLTNEQKELIKKLWAEQQKLRKQSTPKTEEDKKQLGWKTKREIRIDVLKQALLEMK
jgi:predicted transcriptional regulator YheO